MAFADIDGDNDQDVLITGRTSPFPWRSILYINDGEGNFSEAPENPFVGLVYGSVSFADIDKDDDQDVLITGLNIENNFVSVLYINDGDGNFEEVTNAPFSGAGSSSSAFADIDGDNDQDVLISGRSGLSLISKMYVNDGLGNFTELLNTPFDGVQYSAVAISDVDGDGDQDVLISGTNSFGYSSKLYTNDGTGNFTLVPNTPFEGVSTGSIAFADVDGDADQDVLITGSNAFEVFAKLYINDGLGNFAEALNAPFEGIYQSSVAFADIDGDNDQDVFISGHNIPSTYTSKLYINDGMGNYVEDQSTAFEGVRLCAVAFSDVDGDGDQDLLITGESNLSNKITKLYINNSIISSTANVLGGLDFEFTLSPNPTTTGRCTISFSAEEGGSLLISILDVNGKLLRQQREQYGTGQQLVGVDLSYLSSGSYIIQMDNGWGKAAGVVWVE